MDKGCISVQFTKIGKKFSSSILSAENEERAIDYNVSNFIMFCASNLIHLIDTKQYKKNSMVWVRERTIPTERQPLLGEVVANFYG
jgi:hypothetical protein